ncbi:hemerythrin domain-containing protein [Austwickia chelonae]|uniref:hemerythrin domain-containing protein n=1 Tax=Austwickia chelonae TaxID=100225 RepID=UPI000E273D38|nr:hemerythrin domain-containing protein [Austwickia chelonae]
MCQYCGCQDIETIGRLMEEHLQIQNCCGSVKTCIERGDTARAYDTVVHLAQILRVHNAVEEGALYPAMNRFEEYAEKTAVLYDEHDDVDAVIDEILDLGRSGRADQIDWTSALATFDVLYEHIIHEDNGLFPAAAVALDAQDWERCERARSDEENAER